MLPVSQIPDIPAPPETPAPKFLSLPSLIAMLVIVSSIGWILFNAYLEKKATKIAPEESPELVQMPSTPLVLQFKLIVSIAKYRADTLEETLEQTIESLNSPADYRAAAALFYYLDPEDNRDEALELLDAVESPQPIDATLRKAISTNQELPPAEQDLVRDQLGWSGNLVLAPHDEALNEKMADDALSLAIKLVIFSLLGLCVFLASAVLFVIAVTSKAAGKLPFRFRPETRYGPYYLEGFAAYLATMILASLGVGLLLSMVQGQPGALTPTNILIGNLLGIALSLVVGVTWPMLRGVPGAQVRKDLGLHTGTGFIREAFFGIVGYVALLPIVFIGFGITWILQQIVTQTSADGAPGPITHPIMELIEAAGWQGILLTYLLASALVPFTEELMFRGALHRAFRSRTALVVSLVGVAFIFAVIHPQGWMAVPVLMSLAISFGLVREWRDSLVGPIIAHGLHNGTLILLVLLILG